MPDAASSPSAPDSASSAAPGTAPRAVRHVPALLRFALATLLLLGVDLWSKATSFDRVAGVPVVIGDAGAVAIPPHDTTIVVPRVLGLHLTVNRGAVFGLGQGGRWIFAVFSVVASVVIVIVFGRSPRGAVVLHLALGAILAGALGNLYDRLRYGVVRDMLLLFPDVRLPFGWRWPDGSDGLYPWIFNVADVCLLVGLFILMILMYRHDRAVARARAAATGDAT